VGTSDFALVCQKNLTDDDGPYIEIQSAAAADAIRLRHARAAQQVSWRSTGIRCTGWAKGLSSAHEGPGGADDSRKRRLAVAAAGHRPVPPRYLYR